jgi:hypothetical protein
MKQPRQCRTVKKGFEEILKRNQESSCEWRPPDSNGLKAGANNTNAVALAMNEKTLSPDHFVQSSV